MTIVNEDNTLNTYLYSHLKHDLQKIQIDAFAEITKSEAIETSIQASVEDILEIKDEYTPSSPSIKPRAEVTLEERMDQVISPEEVKVLLSLLMRTAQIPFTTGQLVDVKG